MNKYFGYIWKGLLVVLCLIIFIVLAVLLKQNNLEPLAIDIAVRDFFYSIRGQKGGFIYWFFRLLTEFGYIYVIVALIIIYGVRVKFDYRFLVLAIGMVCAHLYNSFIKDLFDRVRPLQENWWMTESSSSFPSGHSSTSAFFYSMLIYLVYHSDEKTWVKRMVIGFSIFIMLIIPCSRLVLGVHYFSDVVAGACGGFIWAVIFMLLAMLCRNKHILDKPYLGLIKK